MHCYSGEAVCDPEGSYPHKQSLCLGPSTENCRFEQLLNVLPICATNIPSSGVWAPLSASDMHPTKCSPAAFDLFRCSPSATSSTKTVLVWVANSTIVIRRLPQAETVILRVNHPLITIVAREPTRGVCEPSSSLVASHPRQDR